MSGGQSVDDVNFSFEDDHNYWAQSLCLLIQNPRISALIRAGWTAIKDHVQWDDEDTVQTVVEDIDTLLLFAGIFSGAILTFVVVSLPTLRPDNHHISVEILAEIASHFRVFESPTSLIKATGPPLLPLASFQVPSRARWLNILWLSSLVFSLSSALLSIIVKSKLRVYLQWDREMPPSRDNVVARQRRLQTWKTWKVPATISVISVFLEIALVLFLVGMMIFSWALDTAVTFVLTITIGAFLAFISAIATPPAVIRNCP